MRELLERAWFLPCSALGWLLRSGRYSTVRIVREDGEPRVRKQRRFYAPPLVWLVGPLLRSLDAGVRILPQRAWEERERLIHTRLRGASVRIDAGGALVLPLVAGRSLAALLEDPALDASTRRRAIELAVVALAELHRLGFTHGDALAQNVIVDLEGAAAHWIDFETLHDERRPLAWRRADDVRALLVTCLVRTSPADFAQTLRLIVGAYPDEEATGLLASSFTSILRRPLAFHLGQAGLSLAALREIARLLSARSGELPATHRGRLAAGTQDR